MSLSLISPSSSKLPQPNFIRAPNSIVNSHRSSFPNLYLSLSLSFKLVEHISKPQNPSQNTYRKNKPKPSISQTQAKSSNPKTQKYQIKPKYNKPKQNKQGALAINKN